MSEPRTRQLLKRATATGAGYPIDALEGDHVFTATVVGDAAVSATVVVEGSNDLIGYSTIATLTLSGTATASGSASTSKSYRYWRANVTAISGGAVSVTSATEEAGASIGGLEDGEEYLKVKRTPSDVGVEKIGNGDKYVDISIDTRPVVCIGGDHPYNQLWGRNGKDGLAQMYADHGIVPYLALNTRSLTAESVGSQYFMGWDKVKTLADAGMIEPVAHGARHYQDWECPDAGIHVKYTGPAATATMYVTSTGVVGTTAGSVEDFSFLFADYPQIDQLVAAIDALPNWSAMRSP